MNLTSTEEKPISTALLGKSKEELDNFLGNEENLALSERYLQDLKSPTFDFSQAKLTIANYNRIIQILDMFVKTFNLYLIKSDSAKKLRQEGLNLENEMNDKRNNMELGAHYLSKDISKPPVFKPMSSVQLRSNLKASTSEEERKACYAGLRSIGPFAVSNGFVELVKLRNACAKELGYEDFYAYKLEQAEGFGKDVLFGMLDKLEADTREVNIVARKRLASESPLGDAALEPHNVSYCVSGDVTAKLDPYFPFSKAIQRWGECYNEMNIKYKGAEMTLDLLDRKGKYSNGFCHWPKPAFIDENNKFHPTKTNFTSVASPSSVGSGLVAITTLIHEAGHAAHFSNVEQYSQLFSQERAPTSVAYAENQSMFLDSLCNDAEW